MSTPLNHARHNKEACDYLQESQLYPDWVVTTAFYSAMHYSYAAIFPLTEGARIFNNFEDYYSSIKNSNISKHGVAYNLVCKYITQLKGKYKTLKDIAHTSRYHDYELNKAVVSQARKYLGAISEECEKICEENAQKTP